METNYKQENAFKQFLSAEVKFVIGIIMFTGGVIAPYYSMRQDIALIKSDISNINSNHEVHDQDILQAIKDLNITQVKQQEEIILLQKQMIILTGKL